MKGNAPQILHARGISPNHNLNQPTADTYLSMRLWKKRLLSHEVVRQEIQKILNEVRHTNAVSPLQKELY